MDVREASLSVNVTSDAESSKPTSQTTSLVQLHPKSKPSQKRALGDLEDWDNLEMYMNIKQCKLQNQFEGMGINKISTIFKGVSIYVNGWTQPKAEELKEMMYAHGGRYEYNLYSNSVVTHTIASNLPNSKILKLGSSIVCKPSWIVDSIAVNMLLPVDEYLLYKPHSGQKKLSYPVTKKSEFGGDEEEEKMDYVTSEGGTDKKHSSIMPSTSKGAAEFVNEFFSHSRLHYLSTWSTELKQFTAEMLKKVTPRMPRLQISASLRGLNIRAVVHIDLDCFFVSVSLRDKPHLWGKPVAVTHAKLPQQPNDKANQEKREDSKQAGVHRLESKNGASKLDSVLHLIYESTSDIASCSYEARANGVCNGMLVGKALKKCPDLILLPYDFQSYREVSQIFYETLPHYSSLIEAVSCDEAYIELTDYCRDFEQVSEVVQEIRNEVKVKTGCTVSAGISHNMFLARMCTRVAKPNGQYYLSAKNANCFLKSQKVCDLPGVGYSTTAKLKEMKIDNCAELKFVPLDTLKSQFGSKGGHTLYNYARGKDSRELKTMAVERKSISVDVNYGIRFKNISEAQALVTSLAKELQRRAEHAQVMGNQLTLKMKIRKQDAPKEPKKFLGHGACDNVSRSLALLQPVWKASMSTPMAVKLLKQLNPVVDDIRGVGLQLSKLVSSRCHNDESVEGKRVSAGLQKNFKGKGTAMESTR